MRLDARPPVLSAPRWCLACGIALALGANAAGSQTLSSRAKEAGCIDAPHVLAGTNVYKCNTASGAPAMFNVPDGAAADRPVRRAGSSNGPVPTAPSSAAPATGVTSPGLPRVDAATQKSRDDLRRRVLQDELAAEEKLLSEARSAYANGSPAAQADEKTQPHRYAERVARLRDAVLRHERNIEMLRRELGTPR